MSSRHISTPPRHTFFLSVWHRGSTRCCNGLPEEVFVCFYRFFRGIKYRGGPTPHQHETIPKLYDLWGWHGTPGRQFFWTKNVWSLGGTRYSSVYKKGFEGKSHMYDDKGWLGLGAFWFCVSSEMYAAEGGLCWFDIKETCIFTVETASTVRNFAHERVPV